MDADCSPHLLASPQMLGITALVQTGSVDVPGVVTGVGEEGLSVTCDDGGWEGADPTNVVVSIFATDALYRASGVGRFEGRVVTVGRDGSVERIQRRKWPRRRMDLPVTLCPVSDGHHVEGVPGRTVDVGPGGACVETLRPLEGEGDPMAILSLPDGTTVVAGTSTVAVEELGDGWRYRLAFRNLTSHDAVRLAGFTSD